MDSEFQSGLVEGHGFSHAVGATKESGFSPWGTCQRGLKPRFQIGFRGGTTRGVLLIILDVALLLGASCKRQLRTEQSFFPASNEVAGWMKISDIRTFEATDLWKYIDGETERYLKAGVRRASTADYNFKNKLEAVVDIYTMVNTDGAKNVFESERVGDAQFVPLGDAAHLRGQSLVFRKGPYLVRIVAYQESGQTQQALLQLGQVIEQRLAR